MYSAVMACRLPLWPVLPAYLKRIESFLKLRHQAIEERLDILQPDMVVEVAAGLSPRGLTYAREWPHVPYLELDLADMAAAKRSHLRGEKLPDDFHISDADILAADFVERLAIKPDGQQKLVVITEGLMPYLSFEEKEQAWRNVQQLMRMASPSSRYLMECYPTERTMANRMTGKAVLAIMDAIVRRRLQKNFFATDQAIADALEGAGFQDVTQLAIGRLARELSLDTRVCPYALFECAVM